MLVDAVRTRLLASDVGRIEDALSLQRLIDQKALPPAPVTAFVVPMGLRGGEVRSAGVPFIQDTTETVAVFLAVKEANPVGQRAKDALSAKIDAVIAAIAGWQPEGQPDVFRLIRAFLVSFAQGVALYQIEFSTTSQVRVLS